MSAQYFMAGFYLPNMTQRVSKKLQWQPIPVHTSSITEENVCMLRLIEGLIRERRNYFIFERN